MHQPEMSGFSLKFVIITILHLLKPSSCDHEAVLISQLLQNYHQDARPRLNGSEPVVVAIDFYMSRLDELNIRTQALSVTGWLYAEWTDDFLKWNPEDYDNITRIVLRANKVWLPDISIGNSVNLIFREDFEKLFRVAVYSNGKVVWEPGGTFETSCSIDITYYPFDSQNCEISFGNWQYTANQVMLTNQSNMISFDNFDPNGEWMIDKTEVSRGQFVYECCPELNYPEVNFRIHMRRKFLYYFVNIMIPCLMMSVLVLMVFYLPPDAGEKISLGVTVLLSFTVFQLMIAESIPTSANTTPLLEIYLLCFMGASTFSVTVSVFVLNLHHRTEYNRPPRLLRKICLEWLAPWLCLGRRKNAVMPQESDEDEISSPKSDSHQKIHVPIDVEKNQADPSERVKSAGNRSVHENPSAEDRDNTHPEIKICSNHDIGTPSNAHLTAATARSTVKLMKSIAHFDSSNSLHSRKEFLSAVKELYSEVCQTRKDDELGIALENEWKLIARVVDRCFFIVCTLTLLVSSGIIFGIMPFYHDEEKVFTHS